jgi:DNA-binding CsgD family transcriptional regulator
LGWLPDIDLISPRLSGRHGDSSVGLHTSQTWFELDPQPKFILSTDGQVVGQNVSAAAALDDGVVARDSRGVLRFGAANSDACFLSTLKNMADGAQSSRRLVLRGRNGKWLSATVFHVPDEQTFILSLRIETSPTREAFAALAEAFHMTRAEQDVLYALSEGRCPKEIAQQLKLSEHTVRAHLRVIYTKMDVRGLAGTIRRTADLT